jgi:Rrf2 family protein
MLSRTEEYAVRAVVLLATHYGQRAVNADDVASILGAPHNYMSKTLNALARHGILMSARGPGGGFSLAVAPNILTVADVVDVFADARPIGARCLLADAMCDPTRPCSAHFRWTELTVAAREPLLRTTIGELCADRRIKAIVGLQ